ncbi:AAA family ATPase [Candidatus Woesearchaeota archaeon]|nr:AAA family ATPase [Candidatus Woesearchaeota archaeon]
MKELDRIKNLEKLGETFSDVKEEIKKVIVGQDEAIEQIFVTLLCGGNALLESYPGLGKTLTIRTLAEVLNLKFSRIQHTPDLMPSDIIGTYVIDEQNGKKVFNFHKGPIFANIVLADEVNRATPKTQSALLEAMQEKQVTVGNQTLKLDEPFFVLATQNPIEQEGSLALDQPVFINGILQTGETLLALAKDNQLLEDKDGRKLYAVNGWTFALNAQGKLEKKSCYLYTLPYQGEMITISSATGRSITVTKNHPFLVNDRGEILWKKAEELTKQDYLVSPARIPEIDEIVPPSHEEMIGRIKHLPVTQMPFDKDFAFWIAFVLSDGYVGEKCVEVCQKNYPDALQRFVSISQGYGLKVHLSERRGCSYARIYSKPLVEYLQARFGVESMKNKHIPSWFIAWPKELLAEFVKTFVSLESSIGENKIHFTQKKKEDVNVLSYMLLRLGILSWVHHDGRIYRLKIQGKYFAHYLRNVGWIDDAKIASFDLTKKARSSFRVVPVKRECVLRLVALLGMNSFHTLPERKRFVARSWYGSYKGIKEGEIVMSVDSLQQMVGDIRNELTQRANPRFAELLHTNPRRFAASIGLPLTKISTELAISKNHIWNLYTTGKSKHAQQILSTLERTSANHLAEANGLLSYFEHLLSEDVLYEKVKSITYVPSTGVAFGLTVPEHQNYLAGYGACGINHNTYPLPEAQSDRFLLKIKLGYPPEKDEEEIVKRYASAQELPELKVKLSAQSILLLQKLTRQVPIAEDIQKKAIGLIVATRNMKELIEYGASPRATIGLVLAAKAHALVNGRKYVSAKDLEYMAYPILRHRIILNFEAERKGMSVDDVIKHVIEKHL